MQWASGVARIFVNVGGQLVQIDLKRQGSEGQGIPDDLAGVFGRLTSLREVPGEYRTEIDWYNAADPRTQNCPGAGNKI